MENNELLQAISNIIDQKLEPIKSDLQALREEQSSMKSDLQALQKEQAAMKFDLQMQIKHTERVLRNEIVETENLILSEVSRVHHFLNEHTSDKELHNIA